MPIKDMEGTELEHVASVLKALGHPSRIRIMAHLVQCNMTVGNIVEVMNMEQAIISQHLRILRQAKLVKVLKNGNLRIYENANPNMKVLLNCITTCKKGDIQ